jgi:hypothetical protein
MNTLTTDTLEPSESRQGREHGPETWKDFTSPALNELKGSLPSRGGGEGFSSDVTGYPTRDGCTDETEEIEGLEELEEIKDLEGLGEGEQIGQATDIKPSAERPEIDKLSPDLLERIDAVISEHRVPADGNVNRPFFMLAHEQRSIEEELNVRFSINVIIEVVRRWKTRNHDHLDDDHDYLTEYLDKLSLVRYPRGRALLQAVEVARNTEPPKQTLRLSPDVQLLASLCKVLQQQAGNEPFFLDGRSAAKALGRPHETVASWLRALRRPLGVISLVSQGRPGKASRYLYVALE